MNKEQYIIVSESIAKSWIRDASTFVMFAALIGLGWLIDSTTMQVVGAIIGIIAVFARSVSMQNVARVTSVEAAYARLDEITGGRPEKEE